MFGEKLQGGQPWARGHLPSKLLSVPQAMVWLPWENTGVPNSPLSLSLSLSLLHPFLVFHTKIPLPVMEKTVSLLSVSMLSVYTAYHSSVGGWGGVAGADIASPKRMLVQSTSAGAKKCKRSSLGILLALGVHQLPWWVWICCMSSPIPLPSFPKGKNGPKIQKEKWWFTRNWQDLILTAESSYKGEWRFPCYAYINGSMSKHLRH